MVWNVALTLQGGEMGVQSEVTAWPLVGCWIDWVSCRICGAALEANTEFLAPGVGGPAPSPGTLSSTLKVKSLLPSDVFSTCTAIVLVPATR